MNKRTERVRKMTKKVHLVHSKFLETELGESVGVNDLFCENLVIWRCKGIPHEVTVLDTHSK